jgi:tRNA-dihydrouridine synthase B
MAVLHGRSKECKFQGTADYRKIRSVVETVHIPIFANGDINDLDSAILAAEKSGSDGLMIGRGAIGQPWIFSCMLGKELPSIDERLVVMNEHLDAIHSFYGRERGTRVSRKHLMAYFTRLRAPELGKEFVSLGTSQEQTAWLRNIDVEMVKSFSSSAEEAAIAA